jgi:peptide/nickel transport system substrate-binding protein
MPEETVQASSQTTKASQAPKNNSWVRITVIFAVFLIISGVVFVLLRNTQYVQESKSTTGLEKDSLRLGWTALSGVYPRNSNPPTIDDNNFNEAIFETLTKLRGSSIVPSLASKWTNPNELTWRFDIRKNVAFHSGDLLTSEDVKYSFDQVIASAADEENSWPSVNSVTTIKSVKIVDSDTVDIETTEPDPILLQRITDVYILSKKQVEKDSLDKAVGTGPFKLVSFDKDKSAVVSRNNDYWGTKPKLKEATFVVYDDDQALIEAIEKGEIDYAKVGLADFSTSSDFETIEKDQPRVVMLFFNFAAKKLNGSENPLLNKKVREAVKLSLDNKALIKEASVSGRAANQFLTQSIVGYNSSINTVSKNIPKAKSLLAEEKVTDLTFKIHTTSDRKEVANAISSQLKGSGITTEVVVEESFGTLVGKLFTGEITAFVAGPQANDGAEYIGGVFKTEADQNILSYSNETVDNGIVEANKSFSPRERRKILEDLSLIIVNDIPVVPLYAVTDKFIVRKNIYFEVNALNDFVLESVSGKEISSTK